MAERRDNVRKFRRRPTLNVGILIVGVIFLYMVISVIIFATTKRTTVYEVTDGSLALDNMYTGFAVRNEKVVTSDYSGFINYFLKDGHKAGMDTIICTIDETGNIAEKISSSDEGSLSSENITQIRNSLKELTMNYSNDNFNQVYSVADKINSGIFEYQAGNITSNLDSYVSSSDNLDFFHKIYPESSGIAVYSVDGYENYNGNMVNPDVFNTENYELKNLLSESLINRGDAMYKIISDDDWDIYVQLDAKDAEQMENEHQVGIFFPDQNIRCDARFSIINNGDHFFGKISMNKYMTDFAGQRYIKFEMTQKSAKGLKIPVSSVFRRNAYTIPRDFVAENGVIITQSYDTQGNIVIDSVEPTVYYADQENYYVSVNDFPSGTMIKKADSDETYIVGIIKELDGVFCVNKGYAVFRAIEILEQNDEYCIVRKGTDFGLATYDHIVLDHSAIKDSDIID